MSTTERLTEVDQAAVECLPLEAMPTMPDAWAPNGRACATGFVVDGDLPMNFGLRYWRFRLDL